MKDKSCRSLLTQHRNESQSPQKGYLLLNAALLEQRVFFARNQIPKLKIKHAVRIWVTLLTFILGTFERY